MSSPASSVLKRSAGYVLGVLLFLFGCFGAISEFLERKSSPGIFFGYVFAALLACVGIAVCAAIRFRYAGGAWFPVGVFLVAGGFAGETVELDDLVRGTQHQALSGLSLVAFLLLSGGMCLAMGHVRHERKTASAATVSTCETTGHGAGFDIHESS